MSDFNKNSKIIPLLSILSAAGAAISIWQTRLYLLTRSGMGDLHSFCNIGQTFDCTAVEMSKYSEFIGGFPLSSFAIAGYLVILTLALFGFSDTYRKNLKPYLLAFTGIALLFSIVYLTIMFSMGKLCLFCLGVDAINLSMFIVALRLPKAEPTSTGITFGHIAGTGVAALLAAFLFVKGLDPQADMKREDLNDIVESVLNSPAVPFTIPSDAPVIGKADAPITIVKFSDYECPACKMGATAIHPLFKRYPNEVKFVFMNYPLDQACNPNVPRKMHEFACEAAKVAICATEQGKFEEAYTTLFDRQNSFEQGKIANILSDIKGLDMNKLTACMNLPSTVDKISRDVAVGGKGQLNIASTPTFYINGKKVEGGLPTNLWIEIIDRMLKK